MKRCLVFLQLALLTIALFADVAHSAFETPATDSPRYALQFEATSPQVEVCFIDAPQVRAESSGSSGTKRTGVLKSIAEVRMPGKVVCSGRILGHRASPSTSSSLLSQRTRLQI